MLKLRECFIYLPLLVDLILALQNLTSVSTSFHKFKSDVKLKIINETSKKFFFVRHKQYCFNNMIRKLYVR